MGNGFGLQMDGSSAHFEPYETIFNDFHDFDHFGVDSGGLSLFPEGPRALRDCSSREKSLVVGCKAQWSGAKPSSRVQSPVVGCKAQ